MKTAGKNNASGKIIVEKFLSIDAGYSERFFSEHRIKDISHQTDQSTKKYALDSRRGKS